MTDSLAMRRRMESCIRKMRVVFLTPYVISMTRLLRDVQSDKFLSSYHAHLLEKEVEDQVEGFKKSSKDLSIPQYIEDVVIQALNIPVNLASTLPKLLELLRMMDRLTIESESDVKKITSYSKDVEQLATRLKEVEGNLNRFL